MLWCSNKHGEVYECYKQLAVERSVTFVLIKKNTSLATTALIIYSLCINKSQLIFHEISWVQVPVPQISPLSPTAVAEAKTYCLRPLLLNLLRRPNITFHHEFCICVLFSFVPPMGDVMFVCAASVQRVVFSAWRWPDAAIPEQSLGCSRPRACLL